jgi:hypothetical protein
VRKFILCFGLVVAMAGTIATARAEVDEDFMRTVEDTLKSATSNLDIKDAKACAADAKQLEDMFRQIEAYFVKKGNAADGVDLSKKSEILAASLVTSVSANDFDTAAEAARDLTRACKSCHNLYKE